MPVKNTAVTFSFESVQLLECGFSAGKREREKMLLSLEKGMFKFTNQLS